MTTKPRWGRIPGRELTSLNVEEALLEVERLNAMERLKLAGPYLALSSQDRAAVDVLVEVLDEVKDEVT